MKSIKDINQTHAAADNIKADDNVPGLPSVIAGLRTNETTPHAVHAGSFSAQAVAQFVRESFSGFP
ncbi:hypothetical protein [Paenarthrobacter ureafaciens]|uniref:hypothetical protein n=1 Tax=Paenarthrobacter ureafaciens TaxID=37931 RepID=UPI0012EA92F0|nr:hypothetical protein [Paenarthrobacter ureafaciens]UOD79722.1 hypothetical protein MQZ73_11170 [Paenarthrobacter ureafaciens]